MHLKARMFQISTAVKTLTLNRIVDLVPEPKVGYLGYSQEDITYRLCLCGKGAPLSGVAVFREEFVSCDLVGEPMR